MACSGMIGQRLPRVDSYGRCTHLLVHLDVSDHEPPLADIRLDPALVAQPLPSALDEPAYRPPEQERDEPLLQVGWQRHRGEVRRRCREWGREER